MNIKKSPISNLKIDDLNVESENPLWSGRYLDIEENEFLNFKPHFGWLGKIECK